MADTIITNTTTKPKKRKKRKAPVKKTGFIKKAGVWLWRESTANFFSPPSLLLGALAGSYFF